jgi:general secretion pathway protein K
MRGAAAMMTARKHAGVAMIIVLWVITLLSVIAISFVHTMRTDINVVANSLTRVKAETLADAALERAIYELAKPQNTPDRWNADGGSREWLYRDITVTIIMQDEVGRIDINTAREELLRGLLLSQGMLEEDALKLMDAIADWRDADAQKRLRGAEAPDYVSAGLNYAPANAPFQSIEELKLVLGMTPELFSRLAPHITVFSRQPGFNEQIADRAVIRALTNVNDEQIDEYISRRDLARASKLPIPNFAQNTSRSLSTNNIPTRIRTDALFADGSRFVREVVVRRYTDPKRPYAYLSWKEGRDLLVNINDDTNVANATTGNNSVNTSATLGKLVAPNKTP